MAIDFIPGDILEPTAFVKFLYSVLTVDSSISDLVQSYLVATPQLIGLATAPLTVNAVGNITANRMGNDPVVLSYIKWTDANNKTVIAYFPNDNASDMTGDDLLNNSFQYFSITNAAIGSIPLNSPAVLVVNNTGSLISKGSLLRITNSFTSLQNIKVPSVVTTSDAGATTARCSGCALTDLVASGGFGVMLIDGVTTALGLDTSLANEQDPVYVNGIIGGSSLTPGATSVAIGKVVGIDDPGAVWIRGLPNVSSITVI